VGGWVHLGVSFSRYRMTVANFMTRFSAPQKASCFKSISRG
jgi:hypothetical protein